MPLRSAPIEIHGIVRLFPDQLQDVARDPDLILNFPWDSVSYMAQFAHMGMRFWKCNKQELLLAAEICSMHPGLKHVVHALRSAAEGVKLPDIEPERKEP